MIDKELLIRTIDRALEGTDLYLVELKLTPANEINVEIDSDTMVDIDECVALTRSIEDVFDREIEDYELEVGSAGLTSPLKVYRQYVKNLGKDMEVLTRDGRKLHGVLASAEQTDPVDPRAVKFELAVKTKVKEPGAKRPVIRDEKIELTAADCKSVVYDLKF
ncbi:MAG: ribosome assembly cofactor RimP [Muribaculaceae bacterium]|nr:ribosome assembly cofactor RimP [Muribaculaceae bacterium]